MDVTEIFPNLISFSLLCKLPRGSGLTGAARNSVINHDTECKTLPICLPISDWLDLVKENGRS